MSVAPTARSVRTQKPNRDYRLDFFRGLALVFIFIDHIPDNVVSNFTLRTFAFCDAAEMFIFISGYTAVLAYGPVFDREGVAMGFARVYRRVWQLYVAQLFLFMIFNAEVAYTLKFLYNPLFSDELEVGDYLQNPGETFIRVLLLQFQPTLPNILPLYIVLLLGLPVLILLIRRHILLGLVPSAAVWFAALMFGWNLPGFPEDKVWYFDPFSWQFLFAIAVGLGFARGRLPWPVWLPKAALAFAAVAAVMMLIMTAHEMVPGFPAVINLPDSWFDKPMLPPLRLLSILALATLVAQWVPRDGRFFTSRTAWWLVLCGQNSLEVFCLSVVLAVMANFILTLAGYGIGAQLGVNLLGLMVMIGFGLLLAWFKAGGHLPASPNSREAT
jgi:hypothetical protein